jgi:hypothetical protein
LKVKFIILTQIGMYSLLYRHILRKHAAFLSADYHECNQVTIGLWLTWCELVNVAIHTCEHFMLKFLLNAANKERYKIFLCSSNLLLYNKKCSAFSVEYPQDQDGLWIKLTWNRSLCNALQLFLILVCSIFKYLLPIL